MRFIPLTNSRFSAIVDDEDYDSIIKLKTGWSVYSSEATNSIMSTKSLFGIRLRLGRYIMNVFNKEHFKVLVDHKFGDIYDNRKQNLRLVNIRQNNCNTKIRKDNTTGCKGVSLHKSGKYQASISHKKKIYYIGVFRSKEEAVEAYNTKAKELHGEFFRSNN